MASQPIFTLPGYSATYPTNSDLIEFTYDQDPATPDMVLKGNLNPAGTRSDAKTYQMVFSPDYTYTIENRIDAASSMVEHIVLFDFLGKDDVYYYYVQARPELPQVSNSPVLSFDKHTLLALNVTNRIDYEQGPFEVDIYAYEKPFTLQSGTENADAITDVLGKSSIQLLGGDDLVILGAGTDVVDGGAGRDTARYAIGRPFYSITKTEEGYRIVDNLGLDGTDTLINIERLQFSHSMMALDIDGNGGQAYRLYQATLSRAPDINGLGTWIGALDKGQSLKQVAAQFLQSAEFLARFGVDSNPSEFVSLLYQNTFHRAPDAHGYATWTALLESGQLSRAEVAAGFSESEENKAALIGVMQNGMEYIAHG